MAPDSGNLRNQLIIFFLQFIPISTEIKKTLAIKQDNFKKFWRKFVKKTWFSCKNGNFDGNDVTSGYTKLVVFNELSIYITGWHIGLILWPILPKSKRYLAEICDILLICAKKKGDLTQFDACGTLTPKKRPRIKILNSHIYDRALYYEQKKALSRLLSIKWPEKNVSSG